MCSINPLTYVLLITVTAPATLAWQCHFNQYICIIIIIPSERGLTIFLWFSLGGWWRWALVSLDGVALSRMVGVSASVNLPLHRKVQKFSSGTGWCGWSWKKGHKIVLVVVVVSFSICSKPVHLLRTEQTFLCPVTTSHFVFCQPDSCSYHLPLPRDPAVTSRLRKPTVHPQPSYCTRRYCSSVSCGLLNFQ